MQYNLLFIIIQNCIELKLKEFNSKFIHLNYIIWFYYDNKKKFTFNNKDNNNDELIRSEKMNVLP